MSKWGQYRRWDKPDKIYDRKRPWEIDDEEEEEQ